MMVNNNVTLTQGAVTITIQTIPGSRENFNLVPLKIARKHSPTREQEPINYLLNTGDIWNTFEIHGFLSDIDGGDSGWTQKEAIKTMIISIELVTLAWVTDGGSLSVTGMIDGFQFLDNGPEKGPDARWEIIVKYTKGTSRS